MIVTFCGHSDFLQRAIDEEHILRMLEDISGGKAITFYLGEYGNFDIFARRCAERYKKKHCSSKLVFVSPYLGEWLDRRRDDMNAKFDEILFPELEKVPLRFAITKRNEWMVKHADYVIGYVNRHYGGAYRMLLLARKWNKPYKNIYQGEYELY